DDAGPRSPEERARNLAETIACPQCDGQSVADSDAEASLAIREPIEQRTAEGASDERIRDELAAPHGEQVLLQPRRGPLPRPAWASGWPPPGSPTRSCAGGAAARPAPAKPTAPSSSRPAGRRARPWGRDGHRRRPGGPTGPGGQARPRHARRPGGGARLPA